MLAEAGVVTRCCRAVALAAGFVPSGNGEFNPWLVYQLVAVGAAQRAVCVRAWLRRWIPVCGAVQELCGHSAEQALCTHAGTGHLLFLGVRSRMDPQPSTFPASPDLLPHTRFPIPLEER